MKEEKLRYRDNWFSCLFQPPTVYGLRKTSPETVIKNTSKIIKIRENCMNNQTEALHKDITKGIEALLKVFTEMSKARTEPNMRGDKRDYEGRFKYLFQRDNI